MTARGKPSGVVVTAVAREPAGFVRAEMTSCPPAGGAPETTTRQEMIPVKS
jgi:hypothetical protein